jgi:DnaJ-class molecular chaperone
MKKTWIDRDVSLTFILDDEDGGEFEIEVEEDFYRDFKEIENKYWAMQDILEKIYEERADKKFFEKFNRCPECNGEGYIKQDDGGGNAKKFMCEKCEGRGEIKGESHG